MGRLVATRDALAAGDLELAENADFFKNVKTDNSEIFRNFEQDESEQSGPAGGDAAATATLIKTVKQRRV